MFRKLDLFPSLDGGKTPTLLGPLGRANINHHRQNPSESTYLFFDDYLHLCFPLDLDFSISILFQERRP
jgi:hypothetical protein